MYIIGRKEAVPSRSKQEADQTWDMHQQVQTDRGPKQASPSSLANQNQPEKGHAYHWPEEQQFIEVQTRHASTDADRQRPQASLPIQLLTAHF